MKNRDKFKHPNMPTSPSQPQYPGKKPQQHPQQKPMKKEFDPHKKHEQW